MTEETLAVTDGRADGALLLRHANDHLAESLSQRGFPTVSIFCRGLDGRGMWADSDAVYGGYLATKHLLELGHRRIAYLGYKTSVESYGRRLQGYLQAHAEFGVEPDPELRPTGLWERSSCEEFQSTMTMLQSDNPPTACFCFYDGIAVRLLELASEIGLSIPEDLSIVGYDNSLRSNFTKPPLTTVQQPIAEIAAYGLKMLADLIDGNEIAEPQVIMKPQLVVRESTAARA